MVDDVVGVNILFGAVGLHVVDLPILAGAERAVGFPGKRCFDSATVPF